MSTPSSPSGGPSRDDTWKSVHAAALAILPRALRLLGVAEADINDVMQEILLAAYKNLDRFDPAWSPPEHEAWAASRRWRGEDRPLHYSPEARWVFGIAWRKVNHYLERAYRRREVPDGLHPEPRHPIVDPAPSGEQHIADRERLELVVEVLWTLTHDRRMLLVLYDAFDVPLVEIAHELGLNYNTAHTRLRLARQDYRAAVKRLRPEQRRALRGTWLVFPLASDFFVRDDAASASVPPAPPAATAAPAPPTPVPAPVPSAPVPSAPSAPAPVPSAPSTPAPSAPAPSAPAPSTPTPSAPPRPSLRQRLVHLGRALGWAAAGGAGTAAVLLPLAPEPPLWAHHFGAALLERPAHRTGVSSTSPERVREPVPVAPAPEATDRRKDSAPRTAPSTGGRDDSFAEERRLLAAARELLSAGDPAGALRQLAVHAERFPEGRLKSIRERLRSAARTRLAHPERDTPGNEASR